MTASTSTRLVVMLVAAVAAGCAHRPNLNDQRRVYPLGEKELAEHVNGWFLKIGVQLRPTAMPHVWRSRIKATGVGQDGRLLLSPDDPVGAANSKDLEQAQAKEQRAERESSLMRAASQDFADLVAASDRQLLRSAAVSAERLDPLPTKHVYGAQPGRIATDFVRWSVEYIPLSPGATALEVRREAATEWETGADTTDFIAGMKLDGTTNIDPITRRPEGPRDYAIEQRVAEELDLGVAVEVLGNEVAANEAPLGDPAVAAAPAVTPSDPTSDADTCGVSLNDRGDFAQGHIVLLGDLEGTNVGPKALGLVTCAALKRGLSVTVALAIAAVEQARLNAFLDSTGDAAAKDALLQGPFWHREYQDGRSSAAMFDLLEALRAMRAAGQPVSVLALDVGTPGNARSAFMSARVLEHHRREPDRLIIAFVPNTLARRVFGVAWNPTLDTLGHRLTTVGAEVSSYDVAFKPGTRWTCQLFEQGHLRCGTWRVAPGPAQQMFFNDFVPRPRLMRLGQPTDEGFDGLFFIGTPRASPPAVRGRWGDEGDAAH